MNDESSPLRDREDLFRLLVERVRDYAIFLIDPSGIVMSWNLGAERIKGYAAHEIIGHHFSRFYPEEANRAGWPQTELRLATADGRFEDEGWRIRKDGSRFWANVVLTALYDDTGRLRGFAKVTRDLTERRRMETLESDNRQMSEFVAMLAHELRNPLAPILMASSAAQLKQDDPERTLRALAIIERQARHLGRLVDDLLDVSRITRGDVRLEQKRMRLGDAVEHAVEAARPLTNQKEQTLGVVLRDDPVVRGDLVRLTQVLSNLLANASKFTANGGRIDVEVAVNASGAQISVTDTGIGIDPLLLPHVFDLFAQDRQRLDRSQGGLGLGLTIAKRIVEMHDGRIRAESAGPGCGSRFEVTLPIVENVEEVDALLTVLVVDDNVDAAQILREVVEMGGHRAVMAYDGETALALARSEKPDIALLDIGLPGMSGYELARTIRGESGLEGMTIVAISGYATQADRQLSSESGFDAHLAKPLALETLFASVPALRPRDVA
jgi:PAS domain S-box-containing protein